ncbi:putative dolichyl pyrophosphate Man9GlcNAc2 alpha-1,3-glucosyltransferase [Canna indica]|uniref:Alpha-1,3-glucosyltransferase n=1 Tax=Canna indica TaxID=4628 RepID=A0AAQ3JS38_9LILI|nr:putative dolichyl pyrophosphate Man9GlcNAc2 alpha-1,3-glucosyltransferase [Canna indica]
MAKKTRTRGLAATPSATAAEGGDATFPWSTTNLTAPTAVAVALFALLVRVLVSLAPYSGQGTPPMYGDYEAQRHWMEITLHTPTAEWYRNTTANDLSYWGLDYPPLTAYQSLAHALLINVSLPQSVALSSSRGFESHESKLMMRWTVLSSDLLVFFPAAIYFVWVYFQRQVGVHGEERSAPWLLAMILLNPCLILIDHGHFQYNCISLGLTLGAIAAVLSRNDFAASILFSLAINHKQMSLYFAPAFFSHLLGKCLKRENPIFEVMKLGFAVIGTFAVVWWPYLHSIESAMEVLHRLAPFERGVFEDYVANFWCSTSLVIKWKKIFTIHSMKLLSLITTVFAFLPSFFQQLRAPSDEGFLFSLLNNSFSFYLFSYQVHEKSILLPLLPASLLALQEPTLCGWLMYCGLLSMYPLICRDRLLLQYGAVIGIFLTIFYSPQGKHVKGANRFSTQQKALMALGLICSVALHLVYLAFEPPKRYPFLFEALIVLFCFSQFVGFTFYTNAKQWLPLDHSSSMRIKKDL